ncbi:MAG: thymidine phosphorylase [Spirochaetes bacterium]|nr:MAG: thymidine phosphorylase [Spirochaetota bacterium]
MRAIDVILKKRDGKVLTEKEINYFIQAYTKDEIPDYQASAFLMAVFFKGMSFQESSMLTMAMINSGDVYDLSNVKKPLVDKHSTGGVGDKVSIILAPLAAACGVTVPMMSGRGLGHTGGTLDKLESIPGYSTQLNVDRFKEGLNRIGFCMIGQSEKIVPADRKMYALRDVTGTVESIPLITASILSKKFVEGAEALVFDVKCGSGAFMKNIDDATLLANSLVQTGTELGKQVIAVISDMNNPLGRMVGNFLEVRESIECLKGAGDKDLTELTLKLASWMVVAGGIRDNQETAEKLCIEKLKDGSAFKKFLENVKFQGGSTDVVENPDKGPKSRHKLEIKSNSKGYIKGIDAYKIGRASVILGAGRAKKEDDVLPGVGIEILKREGDRVKKGDTLCILHIDDLSRSEETEKLIKDAYAYSDTEIKKHGRVLKEIVMS